MQRLAAAVAATVVIGRRERQLLEILVVCAEHNPDRASALAAEHLHEFPDDAEVLVAVA